MGTQLKNKRCSKCFITHFPYPKFCRWAKSSERKVGILPDLTNELKTIIRKHIDRIERKEPRWEDFVIDAVSLNKESLPQFPDLVLENNRKLKGGAKEERIKQFTSKNDKYNTVLNILRSSKLFEQFNNHEKCQVADFCSFCLLRSLMFKINNPKGRKTIVPIEIEFQLCPTSNQQPIISILEYILDKASSCNPEFKNSICIKNGNVRDFYEVPFRNVLKTCIFSCASMVVDLQKHVSFGNATWRCIGAVSSNGVTSFRVGNKWYQSNGYKETNVTILDDLILVMYDRTDLPDLEMLGKYVYQGEDLVKLRQKGDRHKDSEERKKDRHILTDKRKEHDNKGDRHILTDKRKEHD